MPYRFKNWESYQSVSNKKVIFSWKKIHVSCLDDYDLNQLQEFEQARYFKMILLADPSTGCLPERLEEIEFKLKIDKDAEPLNMTKFDKFLEYIEPEHANTVQAHANTVQARDNTVRSTPSDSISAVQIREEKRREEKTRIEESGVFTQNDGLRKALESIPSPESVLDDVFSIVGPETRFQFGSLITWFFENHPDIFHSAVSDVKDACDEKACKGKGVSPAKEPGKLLIWKMKEEAKAKKVKIPRPEALLKNE